MSFKLSKAEIERRDDLIAKMADASAKIGDAVERFNAAMSDHRQSVEDAVDAYNELVSEARDLANDIAAQAEEDISSKSEKWQEGERGQAAAEYQQAWEGLDLDSIEVELPDDVSFDEPEHTTVLQDAPDDIAAFA